MNIPDQNLMSFTAADLKDKSPELGFLRGEVRRHIKSIELSIKDSVKAKNTSIIYEIEQNFAVQKIPNRTAQRFVYSAIIDQLKTNGFEVKLIMDTKRCFFEITWVTEMDRNEIARQESLIVSACGRE